LRVCSTTSCQALAFSCDTGDDCPSAGAIEFSLRFPMIPVRNPIAKRVVEAPKLDAIGGIVNMSASLP
jgi:hypothetical protein